jgi:hypothetical protein
MIDGKRCIGSIPPNSVAKLTQDAKNSTNIALKSWADSSHCMALKLCLWH